MDQEIEQAFAPLKQALTTREFTDADLMDLIGEMGMLNERYGAAMAFHARDIINEWGDRNVSYGEITAEVYRRTFYDREYAKVHGTEQMLDKGIKTLTQFAQFVAGGLDVDDMNIAPVDRPQTTTRVQ